MSDSPSPAEPSARSSVLSVLLFGVGTPILAVLAAFTFFEGNAVATAVIVLVAVHFAFLARIYDRLRTVEAMLETEPRTPAGRDGD